MQLGKNTSVSHLTSRSDLRRMGIYSCPRRSTLQYSRHIIFNSFMKIPIRTVEHLLGGFQNLAEDRRVVGLTLMLCY